MRPFANLGLVCLLASCAGQPTTGNREMAPYNAIVVFQWLESDQPARVDSIGDDDESVEVPEAEGAQADLVGEDSAAPMWNEENRAWIETQILAGLEEHNVFSDFLPAEWENMESLAEKTDADLIVVVRIGSLVKWDEADVSVDPGLAVLTGVLWFGTAVGGLWVEDQVFSTQSDIEVFWRRPRQPGTAPIPAPQAVGELRKEFVQRESVYASGEYNLSLWDRAKFWSSPAAYFTNLLVPATFVPFYDKEEIARSLAVDALDDVKRDLAQKLRADSLRSAGAPFVFRLDSPFNGTDVGESNVDVSFSYRPAFGAEDHRETGLSALYIEVKGEGDADYRRAREYRDEEIARINSLIRNGDSIAESINLGPGDNLVRFSAEAELDGQWITNTIALKGP